MCDRERVKEQERERGKECIGEIGCERERKNERARGRERKRNGFV